MPGTLFRPANHTPPVPGTTSAWLRAEKSTSGTPWAWLRGEKPTSGEPPAWLRGEESTSGEPLAWLRDSKSPGQVLIPRQAQRRRGAPGRRPFSKTKLPPWQGDERWSSTWSWPWSRLLDAPTVGNGPDGVGRGNRKAENLGALGVRRTRPQTHAPTAIAPGYVLTPRLGAGSGRPGLPIEVVAMHRPNQARRWVSSSRGTRRPFPRPARVRTAGIRWWNRSPPTRRWPSAHWRCGSRLGARG